MRAMVFPGQGTQYPGMGKVLAQTFTEAKETFEEIDDALDRGLSKIMFGDDETALSDAENVQPALFAFSAAVWRVIEKQSDKKLKDIFSFAAGHSLGEYTACCAAGAFDAPTAARLLEKRGKAMKNAVEPFTGGMAAIIGATPDILKAVTNDRCFIANDNAPSQTVISGENAALEKAMAQALASGAKRAVKLAVSAPFHTPFMAPAAAVMAAELEQTPVTAPEIPVVGNATAAVVVDVRKELTDQITHGVRWRETMAFLDENGVTDIAEIGAGTVLKGLTKKNRPAMAACSLNTPETLEEFLKTL